MDVSEGCFEGLIEHVCEVVLKLLCALDGEEVVAGCGQAAELVWLISVISITQLIRGVLQLQAHIPADPTAGRVLLHMCPHLIDGICPGLHADVREDAVLWVEELAEALKEEHV